MTVSDDPASEPPSSTPLCSEVTMQNWQAARELFGDLRFDDWIFRGPAATLFPGLDGLARSLSFYLLD